MTRRLSDAVTARNASSVAASLAKYGYRGPGRPREVARWLRTQGDDIDAPVPERRKTRREARPNQAAFRRALLDAYGGRCAITGCDVDAALDAAHVADWRNENDAGAGILLRADLHRLLERGLPRTSTRASPWSTHRLSTVSLVGRRLRLPENRLHWPRFDHEAAVDSK